MEEQTPVEAPSVEETATQPVENFVDGSGNFSEDFLQSLPDDLGGHSILQKYNNPIDLIKGSINAQSLAGKKAEEFWTSDDESIVAQRNEIMGVPSSVDDYEINLSEAPEDSISEEVIDNFKELAHSLGMPVKTAQAIIDWEIANVKSDIEGEEEFYQQELDESEGVLREQWKGDTFDYNLAKVSEAMDYLELSDLKDNPKFANDPDFIMAIFNKIVPLIDSDDIIAERKTENYATISDSLADLEKRMFDYQGSTSGHEYQRMVQERKALLEKIV
jgi:hypothetical protein